MDDLESLLGTEGGEEIGGGEEGGGEEAAAPTEENRARQLALARIREARFKELKGRYREIKDDLYFNVLTKNHLNEFTRDHRHVMMSRISDSNKPVFETLNTYYSATRKGQNPLAKSKSLRETLEEMKILDRMDEDVSGMNFKNIKENLEQEQQYHEEFQTPETDERWVDNTSDELEEGLSDGITDVEEDLKSKSSS